MKARENEMSERNDPTEENRNSWGGEEREEPLEWCWSQWSWSSQDKGWFWRMDPQKTPSFLFATPPSIIWSSGTFDLDSLFLFLMMFDILILKWRLFPLRHFHHFSVHIMMRRRERIPMQHLTRGGNVDGSQEREEPHDHHDHDPIRIIITWIFVYPALTM